VNTGVFASRTLSARSIRLGASDKHLISLFGVFGGSKRKIKKPAVRRALKLWTLD
jgi:hypothetical protein